jgi:hypothetical protein
MRDFFGGLLYAIGIITALLGGGCSLIWFAGIVDGRQGAAFVEMFSLGIVSFLLGFFMFCAGLSLQKKGLSKDVFFVNMGGIITFISGLGGFFMIVAGNSSMGMYATIGVWFVLGILFLWGVVLYRAGRKLRKSSVPVKTIDDKM